MGEDIGRDIPLPVRRLLRQEAGFGCCVCGHPIFEYHHIVEFAQFRHHNPEDMMILCPNHHHEMKIRNESEQRAFKAAPHNIARGFANGQLVVRDPAVGVQISTVHFIGDGFKVIVGDEPLLELNRSREGRLLLSITVYDEDDSLLMSIKDNEWVAGDPLPWDIEFDYNTLSMRRKYRDIALSIDARRRPTEIRADLWRRGRNFNFGHEKLIVDGFKSGGMSHLGIVNGMLVANLGDSKIQITPDRKYGGLMYLVSRADPSERFNAGLETFNKLKAKHLGVI